MQQLSSAPSKDSHLSRTSARSSSITIRTDSLSSLADDSFEVFFFVFAENLKTSQLTFIPEPQQTCLQITYDTSGITVNVI